LIYAVIKDNIKVVKLLLNVGVDLNKQNNDGYTALILASRYNNYREMVELLLKYNADVNKQGNDGANNNFRWNSFNGVSFILLIHFG
jgi:ankyrin repeat protein